MFYDRECICLYFKTRLHLNPIEKIGGLLYCSPLLGYIVCEELRTGKSFATLKQIEPLELDGLPVEIKRYKLLKEFLIDEDGKEILKISNNESQRILYFKLSQNKMTEHDKNKLQIYEKDHDKNNILILEVDISNTTENIRSLTGSYVPITWKELMKWYFDDGEYLIEMTNNLVELFLNMLSIKYELIIPADENMKIDKRVFHDITLLKKDSNYMDTFYTIQEHIEKNFENFEKLKII